MTNDFLAFAVAAWPEIVLGAGICIVLLAGLFTAAGSRDALYLLTMATVVVAAWAAWGGDPSATASIPGGAFVADPLARSLKLFAFAVVALVLVYTRAYLNERAMDAGEFYALILFAVLGISVMISSASFLMMYLGLETLSLSLYAMVALGRDEQRGAEAAIKYFVLGAIASGCLLYGIAMIYGVTGHLGFAAVSAALAAAGPDRVAALAGLCFILVGIAFKFGAVPFHMWLPDVYQGAPAGVTLFVATAPKLAAFALALRLLTEGLLPLQADWSGILAVLSVLSLAAGNIIAIAQTSIKRMLAYSTISHVGFILLGFAAGAVQGLQSALFYTIVYVLMTAAAFGVVLAVGTGDREVDALDDFRGLSRRSPWIALLMLLVMVSMIGVPPLAGFYAKWWVLSALVDAGYPGLALTAVLFSVVGAFYYLRVIRLMYFEDDGAAAMPRPAADLALLLTTNVGVVVGVGLFPAQLLELCATVLG